MVTAWGCVLMSLDEPMMAILALHLAQKMNTSSLADRMLTLPRVQIGYSTGLPSYRIPFVGRKERWRMSLHR